MIDRADLPFTVGLAARMASASAEAMSCALLEKCDLKRQVGNDSKLALPTWQLPCIDISSILKRDQAMNATIGRCSENRVRRPGNVTGVKTICRVAAKCKIKAFPARRMP
jgi:hypothetical protein